MLPLGTSAVTVGFGFLIAFDRPPFDLRASWSLVPLAQALVAVPFVVRAVCPCCAPSTPGCARRRPCSAPSPARAWREVDLPVVARGRSWSRPASPFAVSLGEFGATVFLAAPRPRRCPSPSRASSAGPAQLNVGQAMALSRRS